MSDNYTEMVHVLERVAQVNRAVTLPFIQKKTGLQVVSQGADHGMIVTEADLNVSKSLLAPLRDDYPGSFSEEDDSPQRLKSTELYQVDPIDEQEILLIPINLQELQVQQLLYQS